MEKTYGVNNMIDWNAVIATGKARLCVRFSGGTATKYGATPAEFTTTDPMVQQIIEKSEHFRRGRIFLLRKRDIGSDKMAEMPEKPQPTPPPFTGIMPDDNLTPYESI